MSSKRSRTEESNEDTNNSASVNSEMFIVGEDNDDTDDSDGNDDGSDFYQYMATMDQYNGLDSTDIDGIHGGNNFGSFPQIKTNETKEYSKYQRIKRKNMISQMQHRAMMLCEENKVMKETASALFTSMDNSKRVYNAYTQLFLMYYFLTLHENSHSNLTKILSPNAVVKVPRNPYFSINDAVCVIELHGIDAVQHQREAMKFIFGTIARCIGTVCKSLLFGTKLLQDSFIVNNRTVTSAFTVSSKNAMLCGGRKELIFKGMVICQFGPTNVIESLELIYNWTEIDIQIMAAFGNHVVYHRIDSILYYNYIVSRLQGSESVGDTSGADTSGTDSKDISGDLSLKYASAIKRCFVTSTLDHSNKLFASIDGPVKNIECFMSINGDAHTTQATTMQACFPHIKTEEWDLVWNRVTNNVPSFLSINSTTQNESFFIQIFPLAIPAKSGPPTHAVFIAHPGKRIDEEMCIYHSIYTFLSFLLYKYNHLSKVYVAPPNGNATSNGLDDSNPNLAYYSGVVGYILSEVSEILGIPRVNASTQNPLEILFKQLNSFVKVIKYLEKICASFTEVDVSGDAIVENQAVVEEKSILRQLVQEFNIYFTQVRDSCLIAQCIKHLARPMEENQRIVYEQYLYLCWTRHSSVFIQELLVSAAEYVLDQKFTEALQALGEVIAADPFFAEGYNRRASIYFGLTRSDECFRDIDRVLKLEPFHYGTMCGKALMLMKLSKFEEAIAVFNEAITINAGLGKPGTSLYEKLEKCQEEVRRKTQGGSVFLDNEYTVI